MKKLFLHNPYFRLIAPVFSGVLIYLLILLINNNVEQLESNFISQELFFCIFLAYIIQEGSRILLSRKTKLKNVVPTAKTVIIEILILLLFAFFLVTTSVFSYYQYVLGYSPSAGELIMFNSIFGTVTIIYILLFISHEYLIRTHQKKLEQEKENKEILEAEFQHFRSGINPDLLFDSFNALITLVHIDQNKANQLIDRLAHVYRYILAPKIDEFVDLHTEIQPLEQFVDLFSALPYRSVQLKTDRGMSGKIIPGTLLHIVEKIIRSTIPSQDQHLMIELRDNLEYLTLTFEDQQKVEMPLSEKALSDISTSYALYSDTPLYVNSVGKYCEIGIPKINMQ